MSTSLTPGILAVILIMQLGHPSYRVRVQAHKSLRPLAPLVVPYLKAGCKNDDEEIAVRCKEILTDHYYAVARPLSETTKPTNWPRTPWIDMLPLDYPHRAQVLSWYLDKAREKIGRKGPPHWQDYRLATKLLMRSLFEDGKSVKEVVVLLDQMAVIERNWILKNGKNYTPNLVIPK